MKKHFQFPSCILERAEYAKIVSEINTNYALYKDELFAVHYSVGTDNRYYVYYFENLGFSNYRIIEKHEL